MAGFNVLGLNTHRPDLHTKHPYDLILDVLKGASESLNSFKEVEEALSNVYTKEEITALLAGYDPADGAVSFSDYLKKTEAEGLYQPKGTYLTEHQSLDGKLDTLTSEQLAVLNGSWLPAGTYLTEHQSLEGKQDKLSDVQLSVINGSWQPAGEYLTEHLDLSNYALKSEIPTDYLTEEQYTGTYSKPEGGIPASDLAEGVIPTTLPASDVAEWAKADTKPTYTADEVGALPSTTIIPAAQVQCDWEATEGIGVILNKPEICTNDLVATLYSILEGRIATLEAAKPSLETSTSKAYFAIIPGTTSTYKTNLKNYTGEFTELTEKETTINSDNESGMVVVLYNNWIPEFSAYDENLQTWGTPIKLGSGSSTTGYTKTVDNTDYVLWYSTNAVVSTNRQFKITLK